MLPLTEKYQEDIIRIFKSEVTEGRLCAIMVVDITCHAGREIVKRHFGDAFLTHARSTAQKAGQTPAVFYPTEPESELLSGTLVGEIPIHDAILACATDGNIPVVLLTDDKLSFDWIEPSSSRGTQQ